MPEAALIPDLPNMARRQGPPAQNLSSGSHFVREVLLSRRRRSLFTHD